MLTEGMSQEEKYDYCKSLYPLIYDRAKSYCYRNRRLIIRNRKYPFHMSTTVSLKEHGKWTILIKFNSPQDVRTGVAALMAYTVYEINKYHRVTGLPRFDTNVGKGIYLITGDGNNSLQVQEYIPHFFKRYRQRLLKPQHRDLTFEQQVFEVAYNNKGVSKVYLWDDLSEDDKESVKRTGRYEGYNNLETIRQDGIALGISNKSETVYTYLTFIAPSMFKQSQIDSFNHVGALSKIYQLTTADKYRLALLQRYNLLG